MATSDRSEEVILTALAAHGGPQNLGVSFNGGKDSVVMLYRILEVAGPEKLRAMTIFNLLEKHEFDEMRSFRNSVAASLGLHVVNVPVTDCLKTSLVALLGDYPLKGLFMGTRKGDPNAKYQTSDITPTSNGWPDCLLYCPVLNWSYSQIWKYTFQRDLPICSLYEQGYTSIGCPKTTSPNPHLALGDQAKGEPACRFRPAWELSDESLERAGRNCTSAL